MAQASDEPAVRLPLEEPPAGALWSEIHQMYPMLPTLDPGWSVRCVDLVNQATRLQERLPEESRKGLAGLLRLMNCYYSNLIEGHPTLPAEVDRAMRRVETEETPQSRDHRHSEAIAHIKVQELIDRMRSRGNWLDPADPKSLKWMHRKFIARLPVDLQWAERRPGSPRIQIKPGEYREGHVTVGRHDPPLASALPRFMEHFSQEYRSHRSPSPDSIAKIAAAHQRFMWIHPFLDGNGRVGRLMTDSMLTDSGLDAGGIWRISRGFARRLDDYRRFIAGADEMRRSAIDGRGNLTQTGLNEWCEFFVDVAKDQMGFIGGHLQDKAGQLPLLGRIHAWTESAFPGSQSKFKIAMLVERTILNGSVPRSTAYQVLDMTDRNAIRILKDLSRYGIISLKNSKVQPAFPPHFAPVVFPGLFMKEDEESLLAMGLEVGRSPVSGPASDQGDAPTGGE